MGATGVEAAAPQRAPGADPALGASAVTVTAGAHARLVADVGCFTAAVFTSVVLDAVPDEDGRLVAATSARVLARRVGIDKDTAARALSVLGRCGYLERLSQSRVGARFGPARYRVLLPEGVSLAPPSAVSKTARRRAATARSRGTDSDGRRGQLGLFPASANPDTTPTR